MSLTLGQIYQLAIDLGIKHDLRGATFVKDKLRKEGEKYHQMKKEDAVYFDKERLNNPYSDTRINYGNFKKTIKRLLVGIDVDTSEILLAKSLDHKQSIDAVLSHHPVGAGLVGISDVVNMQVELISMKYNVPINVAQNLVKARVSELTRAISPINHYKAVDAARLMDMPFLSIHTPSDNMVAHFLQEKLAHIQPLQTVKEVLNVLDGIPEYQKAKKQKTGPSLFVGSENNYVGKIALTEVTGGTSGSRDMYEKLSQAGIGTIVGMHMTEEYKREAEKHHINIIIAGHMSSDSLGMNLIADEVEKKGVEIIPFSGFIRVSRIKKNQGKK